MAHDDSSRRGLREELKVAQAEAARVAAENETLRDVVRVLLDEVTPEQFSRVRSRLDALDAERGIRREAGHDEPSV